MRTILSVVVSKTGWSSTEMVIDDWGTWEELFNEHIQDVPPWVL